MKDGLAKELGSNISSLEKDVQRIRQEQGRLESLGKTSESEKRRFDESLSHNQELLREAKANWERQLETHAISVKQLVQNSVSDALKKRAAEQESELKRQLDAQKKLDNKAQAQMQGSWEEYQKTLDKVKRETEVKEQQITDLKKDQRRKDQEHSEQRDKVSKL